MEYINRIELKGRVGTVRSNVVNGSKVVNFSLITDILYKTREGNAVSESTWFNIASCELRAPYPARNMHCCTFLDQVHVVYVLSLPGCDVEPCRLGDRIALSCLVKDVCDQ